MTVCIDSDYSSVNKLSGQLVQLLGAKYDMDAETWTSRLFSSDREYFVAPLPEKGELLNYYPPVVPILRANAL